MPEAEVQIKITVDGSNSEKSGIKSRTYAGTCVNQNRRNNVIKGNIASKTEAYLAACNSHNSDYFLLLNIRYTINKINTFQYAHFFIITTI